jgi:hypothetical protein
MKISDAFPSKYLKATDLNGRAIRVKIDGCTLEPMGDGQRKPVLTFIGKDKALVLNKTNASMIVSAYGDDADRWHGKGLEVYPDKTSMQGRVVDCVRVRVPYSSEATPAPASAGAGEPFNDDVNF